ncbi:hypothetical protein [Nocardia wallacei]|uniref:hypothetical protein n=1 Tax=Nocardia wallacei TaxID=480035 RepID=UPI0024586683|nr:hypothetical protein [Nocardia wallacei]
MTIGHSSIEQVADEGDRVARPVDASASPAAGARPRHRIQRRRDSEQVLRESSNGGLSERIAMADARVALQDHPALYRAMTDAEIEEERELQRRIRADERRLRRQVHAKQVAAQFRRAKVNDRVERRQALERRWHDDALAARRRATDPNAQVASIHRRSMVMSLRIGAVIVGLLLWSGVNVGRNFVPDHNGPSGLTWWALWVLSFGIEFAVFIVVLEIMSVATTASRLGQRVDRSRILLIEACLLLVTVALNSGPHLVAGDLGRATQSSVPPIMVVVCLWLHAWSSNRYAELIDIVMARLEAGRGHEISSRAGDLTGPHSKNDREAIGPPSQDTFKFRDAFTDLAPRVPTETYPDRDLFDPPTVPLRIVETTSDTSAAPPDHCESIASQLVASGATRRLSEEHVVMALRLAQGGANAASIAADMSAAMDEAFSRHTIKRLIGSAYELGFRTHAAGKEASSQTA